MKKREVKKREGEGEGGRGKKDGGGEEERGMGSEEEGRRGKSQKQDLTSVVKKYQETTLSKQVSFALYH